MHYKCYNCGKERGGMSVYEARNSKCPSCGGDWNPCYAENPDLKPRSCWNCGTSQGTMTYYDFRNSKCSKCGVSLC